MQRAVARRHAAAELHPRFIADGLRGARPRTLPRSGAVEDILTVSEPPPPPARAVEVLKIIVEPWGRALRGGARRTSGASASGSARPSGGNPDLDQLPWMR
jgi:hypothetical protein